MKPAAATFLLAAVGILAGFAIPRDGEKAGNAPSVQPSPRKTADREPNQTPSQRLNSFADRTAALTPSEWPAFFRARMNDPESARLAARLWAEQDPNGFWNWLRQQRDGTILKQYGKDLLRVWAVAHPDAAMAAADAITDKESSDFLRREVIETVIANDLEKGLEVAAKALDFNRFSWGKREWMKADPAAAVQGLAALPERCEYREYLKYAVEEWAKSDSPALLAWLKTQPVPGRETWFGDAFKAAAMTDSSAALNAASGAADPSARDAALAGVLASGKISASELPDLLSQLTLPNRSKATLSALAALPVKGPGQLADATRLLIDAPANQSTLDAVQQIVSHLGDWDQGVAWATSLPDPAMRRKALERVATTANPQQLDRLATTVATAPALDLSNELFRAILQTLPDDQETSWLAKLPPDRAAWARAAADSGKK